MDLAKWLMDLGKWLVDSAKWLIDFCLKMRLKLQKPCVLLVWFSESSVLFESGAKSTPKRLKMVLPKWTLLAPLRALGAHLGHFFVSCGMIPD